MPNTSPCAATLLTVLLIGGPLSAQTPLAFGSLGRDYLQLTPAQVTAIDTNNTAYLQAQVAAGRRVYDLNVQISGELRKDEPDGGVVNPAYQEIERICRQRQPVAAELIAKNLAVLNERQRGQVEALRYAYLRDRLVTRAYALVLVSATELVPAAPPGTVPALFGATQFQGAGLLGDPRLNGLNELIEMLGLNADQASEILSRADQYGREAEENLSRMAELSEQLRKGLVQESGNAGSLAIEIEKIRRKMAARELEVRQANRETLNEAQRRRLTALLAQRSPLDFLMEFEAQSNFLLPLDDPSAERPATVAAALQQGGPAQPPRTVGALLVYPGGSRMLEPLMGLRVCVAGPQF